MAIQILDTEVDVCRKFLHFSQRDLFEARFTRAYIKFNYGLDVNVCIDDGIINTILYKCNYWRMRYNAAMAIEQAREESFND